MRRQAAFLMFLVVLLIASVLALSVAFEALRGDLGRIPSGESLLTLRQGGALGPTTPTFWALLAAPFLAAATLFFLLRRNRPWSNKTHLLGLLSFVALLIIVLGIVVPRTSLGGTPSLHMPEVSVKLDGLLQGMEASMRKLLGSLGDKPGFQDLRGALEGTLKQLGMARKELSESGVEKVDMDGLGEAFQELATAFENAPEGLDPDSVKAAGDLLESLNEAQKEDLLQGVAEAGREELARSLENALASPSGELPPELAGLLGQRLESGVEVSPEGLSSGATLSPEGGHHSVDVPLFKVRGARYVKYLRQMTRDTYDGREWRDSDPASHRPYQGERLVPPVEGASFEARVDVVVEPIAPFAPGAVLTSLYPETLDFPGDVLYDPEEVTFISQESTKEGFAWRSAVFSFSPETLKQAKVSTDSRYLQLPDGLAPEIGKLAEEITDGLESPYEKAVAIQDYLKSEYIYDLEYTNAPPGVEPTYWFLFEERRGTCANFANAFVVLARSVGIPARPVAGFAIAATEEEQVVTAAQAHQWTEVLFERVGWITFDPTPPAGPPGRVPPSTEPLPTPAPTLGPMPRPTPVPAVPTVTEITEYGGRVQKGEPFSVRGSVTTEEGAPVDGMEVEIYLNSAKEHGGTIIGEGVVEQGAFDVTATIPLDFPVGVYQVLARALANDRYQESWSDPPITVTSPTEIVDVVAPSRTTVGEMVTIQGTLKEKLGEIRLSGERVTLEGPGGLLEETTTDEDGVFTFEVMMVSRGLVPLEMHFYGTEFHSPSFAETVIEVYEATQITCHLPKDARLGEPAVVSGTLRSQGGESLQGLRIDVRIGAQAAASVITDQKGDFVAYLAPQEVGTQSVSATSPEQDYCLASFCEDVVFVVSSTFLDFDFQDRAVTGQSYPLRGKVLDALGGPVPVGTVAVATGSLPPVDSRVSSLGEFLVPHRFPDKGEWTIRADYRGQGPYLPSAASTSLDVTMPTQLALEFPSAPGAREQVVLSGTLTDATGAGLGGQDIEIRIRVGDEEQRREVTTDAEGRFSIGHVFPEPGTYVIEVSFGGSGLFLPSMASETLKVRQALLLPQGGEVVVRGEENILTGQLLLGTQPVQGATVYALVDGAEVGSAQTDGEGRFQLTLSPPRTAPLGPRKLEYVVPRYELSTTVDVQVKARTRLSVVGPERLRLGRTVELKTVLLDDQEAPLENEVVLLDGFGVSAQTDSQGIGEVTFSLPRDLAPGPRTLVVVYTGRDGLMGARVEHPVELLPPTIPWDKIAYISASALAGLVAVGGLGFLGYRNRQRLSAVGYRLRLVLIYAGDRLKRLWLRARGRSLRWQAGLSGGIWSWFPVVADLPERLWRWLLGLLRSATSRRVQEAERREALPDRPAAPPTTEEPFPKAPSTETPAVKEEPARPRRRGRRGARTTLEGPDFPDIRPPFPDVWGLGYPLVVRGQLLEEGRYPVAGALVECAGPATGQSGTTDDAGYIAFHAEFDAPGEYVISLTFHGSEGRRPATAERALRVVDYREEVVRLFHALLQRARERGIRVPVEATPREAQRLLLSTGIDEAALEQLTTHFEEADYSTHEIARRRYEEAYLAFSRLTGEGRGEVVS